MKWLIAGLAFALATTLAIATVAIRAENVRCRHVVERTYLDVHTRMVELRRWSMTRLGASAPERLAALHWRWLQSEYERRRGQL